MTGRRGTGKKSAEGDNITTCLTKGDIANKNNR